MTPRPDPWMIAHSDQAAAADVEAVELLDYAREQTGSAFTFEPPAAGVAALHRGFERFTRVPDGEVTCPHLDADIPEVAWWRLGADPPRLLCRRCAAAEATRLDAAAWAGSKCDHCGAIVGHIYPHRVLLPSVVDTTLNAAGLAGYTPPILGLVLLCVVCNAQ